MIHHAIMSGKPGARWDTPITSPKADEAWLRLETALARRMTGLRPAGPGS